MRYPILVPLYSNLIISPFSSPLLISAIQSLPPPSIYLPVPLEPNTSLANPHTQPNLATTPSNPFPPIPDLDCFNVTTRLAFSVDPDDCPSAMDIILHDRAGVMSLHKYSWHAREPNTFGIPANWNHGRCQILLTSGIIDAVDEFRLVDVIVAARRILNECVPISKLRLGGLALVGNRKGMFVAVNGPAPEGVGNGEWDGEDDG